MKNDIGALNRIRSKLIKIMPQDDPAKLLEALVSCYVEDAWYKEFNTKLAEGDFNVIKRYLGSFMLCAERTNMQYAY